MKRVRDKFVEQLFDLEARVDDRDEEGYEDDGDDGTSAQFYYDGDKVMTRSTTAVKYLGHNNTISTMFSAEHDGNLKLSNSCRQWTICQHNHDQITKRLC
jgi:hypothetical protein